MAAGRPAGDRRVSRGACGLLRRASLRRSPASGASRRRSPVGVRGFLVPLSAQAGQAARCARPEPDGTPSAWRWVQRPCVLAAVAFVQQVKAPRRVVHAAVAGAARQAQPPRRVARAAAEAIAPDERPARRVAHALRAVARQLQARPTSRAPLRRAVPVAAMAIASPTSARCLAAASAPLHARREAAAKPAAVRAARGCRAASCWHADRFG